MNLINTFMKIHLISTMPLHRPNQQIRTSDPIHVERSSTVLPPQSSAMSGKSQRNDNVDDNPTSYWDLVGRGSPRRSSSVTSKSDEGQLAQGQTSILSYIEVPHRKQPGEPVSFFVLYLRVTFRLFSL